MCSDVYFLPPCWFWYIRISNTFTAHMLEILRRTKSANINQVRINCNCKNSLMTILSTLMKSRLSLRPLSDVNLIFPTWRRSRIPRFCDLNLHHCMTTSGVETSCIESLSTLYSSTIQPSSIRRTSPLEYRQLRESCYTERDSYFGVRKRRSYHNN